MALSSEPIQLLLIRIYIPKYSQKIHQVIGRKYGLHGRNGTGKTCLLATLARKDHPKIPKHLHIVTVEQELDHLATLDSPLHHVFIFLFLVFFYLTTSFASTNIW